MSKSTKAAPSQTASNKKRDKQHEAQLRAELRANNVRHWRESRARWQQLIQYLKDELPLPLPVHVRLVPLVHHFGYAEKDGKSFLIRISTYQEWGQALYTLAEEWAHCMRGMGGRSYDEDHDALWGLAFSTALRTIMKFQEENPR